VHFDPNAGSLSVDAWTPRYQLVEGQTFGWDIVLTGDSGWFLDNGEGSEEFGGCFRGRGKSSAPLHLVRVTLPSWSEDTGREPVVELHEICGEPGGVVANPPTVDLERRIAVGYDSGHGMMTAWRFGAPGEPSTQLWQRQQDHGGHMLRFPESGQLVTYDFDLERGLDEVVLLDIESGEELARTDTGSPVQSVLFPAVGWDDDVYVISLAAITRVFTS
jgi:hypothetical protein